MHCQLATLLVAAVQPSDVGDGVGPEKLKHTLGLIHTLATA